MPTVFVLFDGVAHEHEARRFTEHLTTHHRGALAPASATSVRIGPYSDTPVSVALVTRAHVIEEAADMANALPGATPAAIRDKARAATARFEIEWNLQDDPEPLPETADLVFEVAKVLASLVDGLAIAKGRLLTSVDQILG